MRLQRVLHKLSFWFRALPHRHDLDQELDDEILYHIEAKTEENIAHGMTPAEARRVAQIELGGAEQVKEKMRSERVGAWLDTVIQDIRYSLRTLRKSPGFTAAVVLTLGLGIGGTTAIFSTLNTALLQPLPFPSPDRLTMLWTQTQNHSGGLLRTAYPNVEQWERQSNSFEEIGVFDPASATLTAEAGAEKVSVIRASAGLARVLGVQPFRGRWFSDDEETRRLNVALVSYRFWHAHFAGADPLASELMIDGVPTQIIGILPKNLEFPEGDLWEPETIFPDWPARSAAEGSGPWFVVGRLRSSVSMNQAQSEMDTIARRLDEQLPPTRSG